MILEMAQQKKEIISETMVLMESYFGPKFNALSERFGSLEEKLIPHEAMEIVEDRVDDLEDHVDGLEKTVGFHTQQIDELKKSSVIVSAQKPVPIFDIAYQNLTAPLFGWGQQYQKSIRMAEGESV